MRPRKHILFVEDAAALREALTALLELKGYRVGCAANGREAIEYVRGGDPPDLILLDLLLPQMDGWQFHREMQRDSALAPIPVVIVSAADGVPQAAATLGAVAYLEKPVVLDHLLETIRQNCVPAGPASTSRAGRCIPPPAHGRG